MFHHLAHAHAASAEHLHGHVDHALRVLRGRELGGGGCRRIGGRAGALRGAFVAHPRGAVGEHRGGVDERTHLAQSGLGELKVGQVLAEHLALPRMGHRLGEGAARHAQRGGGHRGAEDVQRLHGQLEAAIHRAHQRVGTDAAVRELQRGQWVRGHHVDVLGGVQARCVGRHHEGADAARARVGRGLGEYHVEIRQAAVADPGLAAVEYPAAVGLARAGLHARDVGAGLGLAEREGGDLRAVGHRAQALFALRVAAAERDAAAAQALHGEGEVGKRRVESERLAQDDERARVELVERATVRGGHAVAQPAGLTELVNPLAAGAAVVGLIDPLRASPVGQTECERVVVLVEEGQFPLRLRRGHAVGTIKSHHGLSLLRRPGVAWRRKPRRHAGSPASACRSPGLAPRLRWPGPASWPIPGAAWSWSCRARRWGLRRARRRV